MTCREFAEWDAYFRLQANKPKAFNENQFLHNVAMHNAIMAQKKQKG